MRKRVQANQEHDSGGEILFTPAAVVDLLSKIEELGDYDVGINQSLDGSIQITVGDSIYKLSDEMPTSVVVDDEIVEQVDCINTTAYEELDELGDMQVDFDEINDGEDEPVEGGILKELAKTLLVGGMVRLTGKMLGVGQ